ncbi:MoeA Molybdopterin biosynthesis enzyme [Rhabdaerophilaceae bacterium]
MAQLSDDCFAFGGALRRLDDALADLASRLAVLARTEKVPVMVAFNRVLAEDAIARFPIPSFDNSAVDGYAVSFADLDQDTETRLPLAQRIAAGDASRAVLKPQTAARIFTGAMMPGLADTVFMQEDVRHVEGIVVLPPGLKRGSNRRLAGEDFSIGQVIVPAGIRLKPQHLAGLAAAGLAEITVRAPLRVAIASTGNEIREPTPESHSPTAGTQFDANRAMLAGLLAARGMVVADLGILPDDPMRISAVLRDAASQYDAVLTSGGVSTGEEDYVKAAIEAAGRLDFWRLAIKPGRPVAMGTVRGTAFLGMPGNPAAVFVTFVRFVGPVLDMLAGAMPLRPQGVWVRSGFSYRKKRDRREYIRVSLEADAKGQHVARRFPKEGAALISSLIAADGLAELAEDVTDISEGQPLLILPLATLIS